MCKRLSFTGPQILFLSRGRGALPTSTTNTALTHQTFLPACLCPLCSSWNKNYWLEALKWSVLRCSEMSIPFSKPFDSWRTESKGIMSDAECKAILILTQGTSVLSTMATSLHITLFILTTGRYYHYTHCTVQELRGWEVPWSAAWIKSSYPSSSSIGSNGSRTTASQRRSWNSFIARPNAGTAMGPLLSCPLQEMISWLLIS